MTDVSLWLTSDAGTVHYACGPELSCRALLARYSSAKVARGECGECCKDVGGVCAFDQFGDHDTLHQQLLLAYSLARIEGRTKRSYADWYDAVDRGPALYRRTGEEG